MFISSLDFSFELLSSRSICLLQSLGSLLCSLSIRDKVKVKSLSCVWLFVTPWTVACQAPSVHGISQARILEWIAISFSRGSSWPRNWTHSPCVGRPVFYHWTAWEVHLRTDTIGNSLVVQWLRLHSHCRGCGLDPTGQGTKSPLAGGAE